MFYRNDVGVVPYGIINKKERSDFMLKVKAEPISNEAFAPFGRFYSMTNPQGYALSGELHRFFPDRLTASAWSNIAFSPIIVNKPEKYVITQQEYHTTTWEIIMPLNDDMILHCAPASAGKPVNEYAKAFIVPKNTIVMLNAAIWHLCPLPANEKQLNAMIVLPECIYANDCTVVDLPEEQQFEIIF